MISFKFPIRMHSGLDLPKNMTVRHYHRRATDRLDRSQGVANALGDVPAFTLAWSHQPSAICWDSQTRGLWKMHAGQGQGDAWIHYIQFLNTALKLHFQNTTFRDKDNHKLRRTSPLPCPWGCVAGLRWTSGQGEKCPVLAKTCSGQQALRNWGKWPALLFIPSLMWILKTFLSMVVLQLLSFKSTPLNKITKYNIKLSFTSACKSSCLQWKF